MCLMAAFNASVNTAVSVSETLEQDSPFDAHPQSAEDKTAEDKTAEDKSTEDKSTEGKSTEDTTSPSEANATKSTFLIEHVSYAV